MKLFSNKKEIDFVFKDYLNGLTFMKEYNIIGDNEYYELVSSAILSYQERLVQIEKE